MRCVGPTLVPEEIAVIRDSLKRAHELEAAAELLNPASNSTRLKIIYLIDRLKELCVCDLAEMLDLSVSAVSQHLAKLRAYGLATTRRDAQTIYYRLTDHAFIGKVRGAHFDGVELDTGASILVTTRRNDAQ